MFNVIFPVFAYQDCIVTTDGKLTDISIENNKLVDVYPLVTVMNEKNTLIVHPLSEGSTRFLCLKNNKNIVMFNIKITKTETLLMKLRVLLFYLLINRLKMMRGLNSINHG